MADLSRPVICQFCRKHFIREEGNYKKTSQGYLHIECYEQKEKNKKDKNDLYQFLEKVVGEKNINYPLIQKQINELTKHNRMTVQGINGTLHYLLEVKKIKLNPRAGIIIVAYHYKDAENYYKQKSKIKSHNKKEFVQEEKTVNIKPQETNKYRNLIDIESFFEEE